MYKAELEALCLQNEWSRRAGLMMGQAMARWPPLDQDRAAEDLIFSEVF
jgi:hypothetical protein